MGCHVAAFEVTPWIPRHPFPAPTGPPACCNDSLLRGRASPCRLRDRRRAVGADTARILVGIRDCLLDGDRGRRCHLERRASGKRVPACLRHRQPDRARFGGRAYLAADCRAPSWAGLRRERGARGEPHCGRPTVCARRLRGDAAAWKLWTQTGEAFSWPGLVVTMLAMPLMYVLARRKIAVAEALGSRAMRADAMESVTCGWLSLVVVVGLVAEGLTGAWWVDAVTSSASSGSWSRKPGRRGAAKTAATERFRNSHPLVNRRL